MSRTSATVVRLFALLTLLFAAVPATVFAAVETVDVWPEGRMPGRGAKEPEGERPSKGDNLHFSADAERELGARFAGAMLELQRRRGARRRL